MSDILRQAFNDEYLSQVDMKGRLELLYSFRKKATDNRNTDELFLINGILDIINGQLKEAEDYFNSGFFNPEDTVIKLARVMINISRADKEDDFSLYEKTICELEEDDKNSESSFLFVKLILSHAYYLMGEKQQDRRSTLYQKAFSITDSVIKEHKDDGDRKKLIRFYNEKGNILLQLADFDESNQPLAFDDNGEPKIFNSYDRKHTRCRSLNREDCFKAAEDCFNEAKNINDKFSYAYNGLGNLYREKGELNKAIEYYKRAIELDNKFFYPLSYLGDCYRLLEMYDDAEKSFKKALEIKPGHVFSLYGLGKIYYELGNRTDSSSDNFNKALKYFEEAIESDESFPYAWFDLGRTMAKLESDKVHKLDLDYILKSLERIGEHEKGSNVHGTDGTQKRKNKYRAELESKLAAYYANIENYYGHLKNSLEEAKDRFERKYPYELPKRRHWENTINYCLEDYDKKLKNYKRLIDIGLNIIDNSSKVAPHEKVLFFSILTGIEEQTLRNDIQFKSTFLSNKIASQINENSEDKHILHILRRWNSYTPIIADNSKGGGYFIECKGAGVVIDPGHNFIDNFKQAHFKFADINTILISHSHDDHTADLESIINLLFRYNKQLKSYTIPQRIAKEKGVATKTVENILNNNEDPSHFEYKNLVNTIYSEQFKKISLYVSEGVFIKYAGIFKYDENCEIVTFPDEEENEEVKNALIDIKIYKDILKKKKEQKNGDEIKPSYFVKIVHEQDNIPFKKGNIHVIKAHHKDLFNKESPLGFVFEFDNTALVYTGDTGWLGIETTYEEVITRLRGKEIMLLSHLGGFKEYEIKVLNKAAENKDSGDVKGDKCYYEYHLGRLGLVEINNILRPRISIISEFGEEFKYNRIHISKLYNESFKDAEAPTTFIPADIGLSINLDNAMIEAFADVDSNEQKICRGTIKVENIGVGENKKGNSLFYFDKSKLTENDCLQALIQDYKIY